MDPPLAVPPSVPPISNTTAPTSTTPSTTTNTNATTIQLNYPDSGESSPRSRIADTWTDEPLPPVPGAKLRLMCSYGGHIMPRPHDKSLCYVGGDTRIVVADRHSSLNDLCTRLSHTLLHGRPFTLKYQLPNEDLDNLISVTTDEDLENMIEEYDRITAASPLKSSRLRLFLFFSEPETSVSMCSLLDDAKSETWFVDALNNSGITRGVSDSATVGCLVNLGVVPASASCNNLEAQAAESLVVDNNNQVKNLPEVHSISDSPMVENSSSYESSSSSPSMANLPPIRVRVDDNCSRLQQEQRSGIEEQFAQITLAKTGVNQEDGYTIFSAPMPSIPATVAMASAAMVASGENMNRVISDDERSDQGAPAGFRKPPLPLQLVQPRPSGALSLPSPDSVASDSSIASANSFSKPVYYRDQVQAAIVENKTSILSHSKTDVPDSSPGIQREQVQDSGYTLPPQLDQNQQQQQQQFVHASTHYTHHPAATGPVPMSSYYPVYAPPSQQQLHPIGQQYPVYVMPVAPAQPYNMTLQPNIADPNLVASSWPLLPQSAAALAAYKDGTPPIYPTKLATAPTIPEVAPNVYNAPVTSNPALVQLPSSQFQQQQYVGLPQIHHPPPQSIAVAASSATVNYGYECGGPVQDQVYYTQQQTSAPFPPRYQSMTPAAAAALSDTSKQFPADNIQQQPNRTSQPV